MTCNLAIIDDAPDVRLLLRGLCAEWAGLRGVTLRISESGAILAGRLATAAESDALAALPAPRKNAPRRRAAAPGRHGRHT